MDALRREGKGTMMYQGPVWRVMISTQELSACCLFILSYFVLLLYFILFYFIPLSMSQKRNLWNVEDNREVALLRLIVRFTSMSGCLRKHTEAFIRVHLEKAIKAVTTDRNRSQNFSRIQQMTRNIEWEVKGHHK